MQQVSNLGSGQKGVGFNVVIMNKESLFHIPKMFNMSVFW